MRKINTSDVFKFSKIIKKSNVKENIAKAIDEIDAKSKAKITEKAGVKVMIALFESCGEPGVEPLIYDLIGGIAEINPDTIAEQPFEDTFEILKQISRENNMMNFFKQASQLV